MQFERLGYFCVDADSTPDSLVFNRTISLRDSWAKLTKAKSGGQNKSKKNKNRNRRKKNKNKSTESHGDRGAAPAAADTGKSAEAKPNE